IITYSVFLVAWSAPGSRCGDVGDRVEPLFVAPAAPRTIRAHERHHADDNEDQRPPLAQPMKRQQIEVVREQQSADDDEDDAAPAHSSLARKWVAHGSSAVRDERATDARGGQQKAPARGAFGAVASGGSAALDGHRLAVARALDGIAH